MTETKTSELKKVTIRGAGKAHRGFLRPNGSLGCACRCPGSNRGTLVKRCVIIAEGWERANCGH